VVDKHRKESAKKRIPKDKLVPLDITDSSALPEIIDEFDPDEAFNYAWKADLLERSLTEVKQNYVKQGMESHWNVFRDRLLKPLMDNRQPAALKEICSKYGIENEAAASHMLETVKRRFQSVLKKQVRQTVLTGQVVEEELKEILKFFEKKSEI
jgi:hypothetical protein